MIRGAIAGVILLAPAMTQACPQCAGREGSTTSLLVMAAMILVPFAIAAVTYPIVRSMSSKLDDGSLSEQKEGVGCE